MPEVLVVTLDPKKFAEKKQQPLPIGDIQYFVPRISLFKQPSPVSSLRLGYSMIRGVQLPFPPVTKAFLYYFTPPEKPRIAGELRFRIASSNDLASFKSGSDLMRTDGQPWSRPLLSLLQHYFPLYEKLREDRLVPDDLDETLSALRPSRFSYQRCQILYSLNDTFILHFGQCEHHFSIVTEQGVASLPFRDQFYDRRRMRKCTPYTGSFTSHLLSILLY